MGAPGAPSLSPLPQDSFKLLISLSLLSLTLLYSFALLSFSLLSLLLLSLPSLLLPMHKSTTLLAFKSLN